MIFRPYLIYIEPLQYVTMCVDTRLPCLRILSPAMPSDHLVSRPPADFVTDELSPTADSG